MRKWFEMRAASKDVGEILIYDEIGPSFWGEDTVSAKGFDESLKALGDVKEISLRINSPGGVVYDGVAIFNMLKNHPARVTARVDGIAASAASLVLMAADEIVIPENAFLLIHEPRTVAWGTADSLIAAAADLETMTKTFAATYSARSGMPEADVVALMAEDRLMDAEEAVSLGLADKMAEPVKMAASFSLAKLPTAAQERLSVALKKEPQKMTNKPAGAQPEAVAVAPVNEPVPVAAAPVAVAPAPRAETVADIDAAYPALTAQIRAEAASAERARILGIEEVAVPGHDALVATMKADGKTSPEAAAAAILKAEKAVRGSNLASIKAVEAETGNVVAAPTNEAPAAANDGPKTRDEYVAEFNRSAKLREEFGTAEAYAGYALASASGKIRTVAARVA
jgi:ATP-dependent Clp protease, protease subunit